MSCLRIWMRTIPGDGLSSKIAVSGGRTTNKLLFVIFVGRTIHFNDQLFFPRQASRPPLPARSLPVCCSMPLLHTISFSFHTNNNNSMITGEKHKYAAGFPKSSSVLACNFFTTTKSKSINQHLLLLLLLLPASIQSNSQMRKRSIDCPGRRQWRIRWFFFFVQWAAYIHR